MSRRFTIAGPLPSTLLPRLFHSHLHFYIYLEWTLRPALPRPRLFIAADRPASCGFDKNSSSMTFPDTLFSRLNIARKLSQSDVSKGKQAIAKLLSIKTPLFSSRDRARLYAHPLGMVRVEDSKIGRVSSLRVGKLWSSWKNRIVGTPVSRRFNSYYSWKRRGCAVPVYPGRSVHSAPIDNRWNKKLEFVYSLVTQIRAATLLSYPLLPSSPFHVLQHQRPFSSIASSSWIPTSSLRVSQTRPPTPTR